MAGSSGRTAMMLVRLLWGNKIITLYEMQADLQRSFSYPFTTRNQRRDNNSMKGKKNPNTLYTFNVYTT